MATNEKAWHIGYKWTTSDPSNPTGAIAVDTTSKAAHFCDVADVDTDWNVSAATHPTLYIHSATTPATDYISIYHDATDGYINVAGGSLKTSIDGTSTLVMRAGAFTAGSPAYALTTTNASTSGSTSAESFLVSNTQTGVGGVGGRARFYMTTNVALGGWSNALKAEVVYGASGRTTGMGSAFCAEMAMSAGTTSGTYAPLESEVVTVTGDSCGTATSFLYMNNTGTGTTVMNSANGYLFELGSGITDTAGGIFETEAVTSWDATHVLKIRIAGTAYYIPLNTVKNN